MKKLKRLTTEELRTDLQSFLLSGESLPTDNFIVDKLVARLASTASLATGDGGLSLKERMEALCEAFSVMCMFAQRDHKQIAHPLISFGVVPTTEYISVAKWIDIFRSLMEDLYSEKGLFQELMASQNGLAVGPFRMSSNQFRSTDATFLIGKGVIRTDLRACFPTAIHRLTSDYMTTLRRIKDFVYPFTQGYFGSPISRLNQRTIMGTSYFTIENPYAL